VIKRLFTDVAENFLKKSSCRAVFPATAYLYIVKQEIQYDNVTLVAECVEGNQTALSRMYSTFAPRMLCLIKRYVHDSQDAEDILHDGFIVAFTRLSTLRYPEKLEYWLATIMKNLSLKFLQEQDVTEILHAIPDVVETPLIDDIINIEVLEQLIRKLPDGYQKVFRLAVLENKTHKEIGELLGIAPHSSSSQLYHARMMMRKFIAEYKKQTGMLALLILLGAGFLVWYMAGGVSSGEDAPGIHVPGNVAENAVEPPALYSAPRHGGVPGTLVPTVPSGIYAQAPGRVAARKSAADVAYDKADSVAVDSTRFVKAIPPAKSEQSDSMSAAEPLSAPVAELCHVADAEDMASPTAGKTSGDWSLAIGVNIGSVNYSSASSVSSDVSSGIGDGDYLPDDGEKPDGGKDPDVVAGMPTRSSGSEEIPLGGEAHANDIPVVVSFLVQKSVAGRFGLETGLTYTYLHSRFRKHEAVGDCRWHYLGIPLKVKYDMVTSGRFRVYVSGGVSVEIPLYSGCDDRSPVGSDYHFKDGSLSAPVQWSVSGGVGISYSFSDRVSLFVEPTVGYHFGPEPEVPNIWRDDPVSISFPVGIRFTW